MLIFSKKKKKNQEQKCTFISEGDAWLRRKEKHWRLLISGTFHYINNHPQRLLWNSTNVNVCYLSLVEFATIKNTKVRWKWTPRCSVEVNNYVLLIRFPEESRFSECIRIILFIILIWYIMTSSTSLFTVRRIHYCYCCWALGQKYLFFQTKNSQKQQTVDWYCRYGILECHKNLE